MVGACRRLLTDEFDNQLQGLYGIYALDGRVLELEKLTTLDDDHYQIATLLRERVLHLSSGMASEKQPLAEAVRRVLREQSFTLLNRFAALRMVEERGFAQECVGQGLKSKGFQVFETVARSGLGGAYERYVTFIHGMFDEMSLDLGVLFDRWSPFGLLFPREPALLKFFDLLNDPELKPLWKEDETIGWIYQYFNDEAERKKMREESAAPRNSRELAVRNQFFTPRYVVEFLTDNTLGRIWYEMMQGNTRLKEQCRYLVRRPTEIFLTPGEKAPEQPKLENLSQEDLLKQPDHIPHRPLKDPRAILMLDPACGSMHFGLYAFDLFEVIYAEAWELVEGMRDELRGMKPEEITARYPLFSSFITHTSSFESNEAFLRQVPRLIIEHNIHGIDIDPRCAQIAGLSLWLRAQKAWHRLGLKPAERPVIKRSNIVCAEPMPGEKHLLREFVDREFPHEERGVVLRLLETIFDKMQLAGEAGSLLKIEEEIRTSIEDAHRQWQSIRQGPELFSTEELNKASRQPELAVAAADTSAFSLLPSAFFARIEERIYDALRDYAEQAEHGGGFQRRLFAEDAARGFAFIDVCRKRYDVALMNPPFGQFSKLWKDEAAVVHSNSCNDILGAFVDAFVQRLHMRGRLGAITSRTCFFLTSFKDWREKVILTDAALTAVADLGQGVMDNAMVEAAAYVMERKLPEAVIPFIRAIAEHDKQAVMDACVAAYKEGTGERRLLLARQETFKKLPDSPFVYWVLPEDLEKFAHRQQFEPEIGVARQGLATGDDPRFCRAVWEVAPQDTQFVYYPTNGESFCRLDDPIVLAYYGRRTAGTPIWAFHVKAGASQPWYSPITLKINWDEDGAELRNFTDAKGKLRSRPQNVAFYYRPGFSWTRRAVRFFPYIIPGSCIPSVSRYMAFPKQGREFEALGVCSARIASAFMRFYGEKFEWPNFLVENLKMLPWPTLFADSHTFFRELAVSEVRKRRIAYQNHEPFHEFLVPFKITDFSANGQALSFDPTSLLGEPGEALVAQAYGFESDAALRVERDLIEAISFQQSGGTSDSGEDGVDDDADFVLDFSEKAQTGALLSYLTGVALGRWDIRYATGEQAAPELPDPFAPLPVCPPGQLQNEQGLPLGKEQLRMMNDEAERAATAHSSSLTPHNSRRYPIEIPWDGILVDDSNHPLDIERRVREVIEIVWKDRAEAIEHEACEILGVKSLRDYYRKPPAFFADHLKRYSKSRRQAPIYWPLSTASGSYTLWIYYHRLTDQTLFQCVNDFVKPKLEEVMRDELRIMNELQNGTAASVHTSSLNPHHSKSRREELEELTDFKQELQEFRDELLRVAGLPYKPNLNDGVIITASPLWKLFRLPKWQKDLKACWASLEAGEYDWAHLAYTIWPDRVRKVCKTDRSIAIAHGLEELCEAKAPEKKAKRGKKKMDEEQPDLPQN
jgi:hypothetical protein